MTFGTSAAGRNAADVVVVTVNVIFVVVVVVVGVSIGVVTAAVAANVSADVAAVVAFNVIATTVNAIHAVGLFAFVLVATGADAAAAATVADTTADVVADVTAVAAVQIRSTIKAVSFNTADLW